MTFCAHCGHLIESRPWTNPHAHATSNQWHDDRDRIVCTRNEHNGYHQPRRETP